MDPGMAKIAVQIAINSALVDDGHKIEAQPKDISSSGIYHPEPIIGSSLGVRMEESKDPSV